MSSKNSDLKESNTGSEEESVSSSEEEGIKDLTHAARTGRGLTLMMLLQNKIVQSGNGTLSLEYLGNKFTADLLNDGQIRFLDDDGEKFFKSPSAWAIHCKRKVNPEKKSGCGWASVKYKGKRLDALKSTWMRNQRGQSGDGDSKSSETSNQNGGETGSPLNLSLKTGHVTTGSGSKTGSKMAAEEKKSSGGSSEVTGVNKRVSVDYDKIKPKSDQKTLVKCTTFSSLGKIQPYTISMSASCQLLMDFHSHLTTSEIVGYLGGKWHAETQHMIVEQAYPCKCRLKDAKNAAIVEREIRERLYGSGQSLVGWYHSHPNYQPDPSIKDLRQQMNYQLQLKGAGELDYYPCVAFVISPYDAENPSDEAKIRAFWVMPPPEGSSVGMPMDMAFSQGSEAPKDSQQLLNEIQQLLAFYKGAPDMINFSLAWKNTTYFEKLRISLSKKLPGDEYSNQFLDFLKNCLKA